MIWTTIAIGRISMARHDDVDAHVGGTHQNCVEIVNLEPQQDAISIRFVVAIRDGAVMMFYFEAMQLKDKLSV